MDNPIPPTLPEIQNNLLENQREKANPFEVPCCFCMFADDFSPALE
jgi:hypothetical protein